MAATAQAPFLAAMSAASNVAYTENNSLAHASTLDARLDLFYKLLPNTEAGVASGLFENSWKVSPEETLKLMFHNGDIRKGKGNKKGFLDGLHWLAMNHPETLLANLKHVPTHTYWKDLLTLLMRLTMGENNYEQQLSKHASFNAAAKNEKQLMKLRYAEVPKAKKYATLAERAQKRRELRKERKAQMDTLQMESGEDAVRRAREERRAEVEKAEKEAWERVKEERKRKAEEKEKAVKELLETDELYQRIYDEVATCFANQMKADIEHLESGDKKRMFQVSLAGKYAPSLKAAHERDLQMTNAIAQKLFPEKDYRLVMEDGTLGPYEVYLSKVRDRYRKVYARLRAHQRVPESFMGTDRWNVLPYNRVPSICMKRNSKNFLAHDRERFESFLGDVKTGKKKIASGALMPHEMVHTACTHRLEEGQELTNELQWQSYVERLRGFGCLDNAIAVCDVSGSMTFQLSGGKSARGLDVAMALSLLMAEIVAEPFRGHIITFSAHPQFHKVQGDTLRAKVNNIARMHWEMNTHFQAVFNMILLRAQQAQLPPDQMIKTVFVFSDMQFDQASRGATQTDHELIQQKFQAAGYDMPMMVYWNLNGHSNVPVTKDTDKVALVSGYSGNLFKLFTEGKELPPPVDPLDVMRRAIEKGFDELVVVD
ncbi:hypothetical protein HDV00_000668 [Rhizophlyctis rosea]|nr:hypothetical protein HDV00_000668 [Rhizophlyctis rosea]